MELITFIKWLYFINYIFGKGVIVIKVVDLMSAESVEK